LPKNIKPRRRSGQRQSRTRVQQNPQLKQLVTLNRQQMLYGLPATPDIQFPVIRQNEIHNFVLSYVAGTISSAATGTSGGFIITLNSFPTSSQFTSLFDRYRIMTAKAIFDPVTSLPASGNLPGLQTVIDYDDASVSTNLLDRDTAMTVPCGTYFERNWTPHVATSLYTGSFTGFGNLAHLWIDAASPSVQHYALKYNQPSANTALALYEVTIRCHIQFRNNF
jgi:hypothetical protein